MSTIITIRRSTNGYLIVEDEDKNDLFVYDVDNFDGFIDDFIFPEWNKKFNKLTITFEYKE